MPAQGEYPAPLAFRPLGATGLQVTPICVGAAPLGNMPETFDYEVPEERALATIRAVFASPLNFLDTAASYGDGESERRIGIVLGDKGRPRFADGGLHRRANAAQRRAQPAPAWLAAAPTRLSS